MQYINNLLDIVPVQSIWPPSGLVVLLRAQSRLQISQCRFEQTSCFKLFKNTTNKQRKYISENGYSICNSDTVRRSCAILLTVAI